MSGTGEPPNPTVGATDGDASTTDADTDGEAPDAEARCQARCENLIACNPEEFEPLGLCVEVCLEEFEFGSEGTPECQQAFLDYDACLTESSCRELLSGRFCVAEEEQAFDGPCVGDSGCGVAVMPPSGGACGKALICDGSAKELLCEGDTCTCVEDEVEGASCPSAGICDAEDWSAALEQAAIECCGFEL